MSMFKQFLTRLGLKVPIVQAPMANVSTTRMASAVYNSGGLGSLALSPIDITKDTNPVFEQISEFRSLSGQNAIVNCNFFCFDPREQTFPGAEETQNWLSLYERATGVSRSNIEEKVGSHSRAVVSFKEFEQTHPEKCSAFVEKLIAARVGVASFHFGVPSLETIQKLQKGGISVWGCVTSVQEAELLAQLGLDALVCQGYEAGGHRGNFLAGNSHDENLSTSSLFHQVKTLVDTFETKPFVIPSGGIVDGEQIMDFLEKGAAAVQLGTVFIPTLESCAPDFIARTIREKTRLPTIMTPLISGRNARTLRTPFVAKLAAEQAQKHHALPSFGYATSAYRKFASGEEQYGFFLAGQNYHLVEEGKSASEVMESLEAGIEKRARQLNGNGQV